MAIIGEDDRNETKENGGQTAGSESTQSRNASFKERQVGKKSNEKLKDENFAPHPIIRVPVPHVRVSS